VQLSSQDIFAILAIFATLAAAILPAVIAGVGKRREVIKVTVRANAFALAETLGKEMRDYAYRWPGPGSQVPEHVQSRLVRTAGADSYFEIDITNDGTKSAEDAMLRIDLLQPLVEWEKDGQRRLDATNVLSVGTIRPSETVKVRIWSGSSPARYGWSERFQFQSKERHNQKWLRAVPLEPDKDIIIRLNRDMLQSAFWGVRFIIFLYGSLFLAWLVAGKLWSAFSSG
jgi:hypothetical protein